jgi:6-pyruvoyltetrahydropterin/6-carboxytetrahydropterin synthase
MTSTPHFEICVQTHFSAAHHLRGYAGNCEKPHGHNWIVEVRVECERLNDIGIGVDFRDVKAAVKSVLEVLDHTDLNTIPQFAQDNPSSENIAKYVYATLASKLACPGVRVARVSVGETPNSGVTYWED